MLMAGDNIMQLLFLIIKYVYRLAEVLSEFVRGNMWRSNDELQLRCASSRVEQSLRRELETSTDEVNIHNTEIIMLLLSITVRGDMDL